MVKNHFAEHNCLSPLAVNLSPVAHLQHQDAQRPVLDMDNDAVVAHTVLPKFPQLGTLERLAHTAWVIKRRHAFTQKRQDASGWGVVLACIKRFTT